MGQCSSNDVEKIRSLEIEKGCETDHQFEGSRLVLLGPGESGKSTFMKQIMSIYGKGHNPSHFTHIIHKNVLESIQNLIEYSEEFSLENGSYAIEETLTSEKNMLYSMEISTDGNFILSEEEARMVDTIWKTDGIQNLFGDKRPKLQILDSAPYFLNKVEEIVSPDYVPTNEDIVLSRVRTTGINECSFILESHKFTIVDVGGQRSERKKWIHLFEDCTGVIFFAAISEFDQSLYENEDINRLDEAEKLFSEICNSRWFTNSPIVLFLNKKDIFQEKVKTTSIKDTWSNDFPYTLEEQTYENSVEFFKKKFEALNRDHRRQVYTHVTCVIDNSVKALFTDVSDIILKDLARQML